MGAADSGRHEIGHQVKTERRISTDRRQVADPFAPERPTGDRRTMCWEVENCNLTIRYRCPAFILRRPCWELWAVDGVGPVSAALMAALPPIASNTRMTCGPNMYGALK